MNSIISTILTYSMIIGITALYIGNFLLKGFFWKFLKVKFSGGQNLLVKIKEVNRDYYRVGKIIDGDLLYSISGKDQKRIKIPKDKAVLYKSIGITWIDVDSETNGICTVDYSAVSGYDAEKFNDLYLRALYKPKIDDNQKKLLMIMIAVAIVLLVICLVNIVNISDQLGNIQGQLSNMKGSVVGGNTI